MQRIATRQLGRGKFLALHADTIRTSDGSTIVWERVTRARGVPDIVGVFAVTRDRTALLMEQYRPAIGSRVLELPAGLCDVRGETLTAAAHREFAEETGYGIRRIRRTPIGPECSGVLGTWFHLFVGRGYAEPVVGPCASEPDDVERALGIRVIALPIDDLPDALRRYQRRTRNFVDGKILGGLAWWRHFNPDFARAANNGGVR